VQVAKAVAKSLDAAGLDSTSLLTQAVQQNLGGLGDLLSNSVDEVWTIGGHLPNPTDQPHFFLQLSHRNGSLHGRHICK